jgi:phage-related protein
MSNLSIYDVSAYNSAIPYNLNDIVLYNNYYYYSLKNNNQGNVPSAASNAFWGGYRSYSSAVAAPIAAPEFIWESNNSSEVSNKPAINLVKFGEGYEQRSTDGINNNLLRFNLVLEGRDKNETRAILHFLHKRRGVFPFFYRLPFPYNFDTSQNYPKRFVCEEWAMKTIFFNNYTITTTFLESTNI